MGFYSKQVQVSFAAKNKTRFFCKHIRLIGLENMCRVFLKSRKRMFPFVKRSHLTKIKTFFWLTWFNRFAWISRPKSDKLAVVQNKENKINFKAF